MLGRGDGARAALLQTGLITVFYQSAFFLITYVYGVDTVTDIAGTSNFFIVTLLTLVLYGSFHLRQFVVSALVIVWALRLSVFLLMRILSWGQDRRLDGMRGNIARLAVFWIFQAAWVWIASLPVIILNSAPTDPAIGSTDYCGWLMFSAGFVLETLADAQKLRFRNDRQSGRQWLCSGAWSWSRHPNYFGEILLWIGIFLSSSPVFTGWDWLSALSPAFITWLLLFVSGVPILESRADKRHGEDKLYNSYRQNTSILVPIPPPIYAAIPSVIKRTILLDWDMYHPRRHGSAGRAADESSRSRSRPS